MRANNANSGNAFFAFATSRFVNALCGAAAQNQSSNRDQQGTRSSSETSGALGSCSASSNLRHESGNIFLQLLYFARLLDDLVCLLQVDTRLQRLPRNVASPDPSNHVPCTIWLRTSFTFKHALKVCSISFFFLVC